jgi:hypothetical protein
MRQQLLGPKAFPVERMLAIFYSIIDEKLDDAIDIPVQVNIRNRTLSVFHFVRLAHTNIPSRSQV